VIALRRTINCGPRPVNADGEPLCLHCLLVPVRNRFALTCSAACAAGRRTLRVGRKARFRPCPVCGLACVRCLRLGACREAWCWEGRRPVRTDGTGPLYPRIGGAS
jgi:hypothetical protein